MQQNLGGNIWKYTLVLIANKRIFVAILGAYYLSIPDVTAWWIGIILLAGNFTGFIFEIPSGYVSDKVGHKQALLISSISMVVSTAFFLFAESITFLILGSIFLSLSHAFHSGAGSAFMHETLRGLNRENEYTKIMGKISSIGFAVPIILMVLVPFLVSVSFKTPFLIALVVDIIGLCAVISLVKPHVPEEHIKEIGITNFKQVIREGYRLSFFRYALFTGLIAGLLAAVSVFRAPYQTILEIPIIWFGVLFGIGRGIASLLLAYSGEVKQWFGDIKQFYRYQLVFYTALFFILGTVSSWWIVVVVFIVANASQWGLSRVNEGYLLEVIRTSKFKATLLSVKSQVVNIVAGILGFGLGFMIDRFSYEYGFLSMSAVALVTLLPLYIYIVRGSRESST